jgi:hypothetical protein
VNLTAYSPNSAAVQDMSAEVVDSNPYSRLMALQRMGIVDNYERIRDYSVAIVVSTIPHLFWHWDLGQFWRFSLHRLVSSKSALQEPPLCISLHCSFYMSIGRFDTLSQL